ncbi:MAG: Deoxyribonuclease, TatD family [Candidatus Uhrbacteria bacterium GW2011_GWF2_41_16]|uniref:Deoxyribonuclease, TatD family n=2 Tax=Candidatus Uhriibacteriota TaxID=1752732 RepID=A0A0G0V8P9_9BACT|nr:MAG: Deoxyribonuclease, TatD family [Candidatus Uhrbacteria bacterium GW2011_GWC2_41_11]KKR97413.1 MAG: Deoxyribonuclease, TatD family [Candidatus Uhrbacteria bacterium GW2011_GWF2_41_16]HBP00568.1 hydrolase TatD [Candidatus Uhrbacteria bacterium]
MHFFDTHCHVHFNAYKNDVDEVIRASLGENVFMITVGTQSTTSKNAVTVAEQYEGIWASIGLHPNHTTEQEFFDEEELTPETSHLGKIKTRSERFDLDYYRALAQHPKVIAIGECGLDFYHIPEDQDRAKIIKTQEETTRLQFDLADELHLPLIIHTRDAFVEQKELIQEYVKAGRLERRGVIHCFTGTLEQAQMFIELGFLISFTGIVTFPPRKGEGEISPLQKVARDLPLEKIMIETDAPYLAPVPLRGKRNEPRYVRHVAEKIAVLKGISVEEVAEKTFENTCRLFRLDV